MGVWFLSFQLRRAPDESRTLRRGKKKEEKIWLIWWSNVNHNNSYVASVIDLVSIDLAQNYPIPPSCYVYVCFSFTPIKLCSFLWPTCPTDCLLFSLDLFVFPLPVSTIPELPRVSSVSSLITFAETGQPPTARKRSFVIRGTRYGFKMGFQSTQRHLNASFLWSSVRSALDLYGNCYSRSRCQKSSFRYLVLISSFSWTVCLFLQDGKFHPNGSPCQVEKWRLCLFLLFLADSIQSSLVSYSFSPHRARFSSCLAHLPTP